MTQTVQTGAEIKAALVEGAKHLSALNIRAAVHLLVFTDLPNQPNFAARFLFDGNSYGTLARTERGAIVHRWVNVGNTSAAEYLGSDDRRLLEFAASLASGSGVNLREATDRLGPAHTQRLIEAISIAAGHSQ